MLYNDYNGYYTPLQALKFLFALAVSVGYTLQFMLAHELLYGRIKKWIKDPSKHLLCE